MSSSWIPAPVPDSDPGAGIQCFQLLFWIPALRSAVAGMTSLVAGRIVPLPVNSLCISHLIVCQHNEKTSNWSIARAMNYMNIV